MAIAEPTTGSKQDHSIYSDIHIISNVYLYVHIFWKNQYLSYRLKRLKTLLF